jgi:phosphoribosylaminoimidazolecarboxamide formyltransferase/IMP cyclohydrolase
MRIAGLADGPGRRLLSIIDRPPADATVTTVLGPADAAVVDAVADRYPDVETVTLDDVTPHSALADRDIEVDLIVRDGYDGDLLVGDLPPVLAVHDALLPAFPGPDPVEAALSTGVRVSGATTYVVADTDADETVADGADEGPLLTQEPVAVYGDDDRASLGDRVARAGDVALRRAVRAVVADDVSVAADRSAAGVTGDEGGTLPARRLVSGDRRDTLRYGENPHQAGAVYDDAGLSTGTVVGASQLNEGAKALSFNNYNDADAALELVREFDRPAAAVIKHTNPAGCATADTVRAAYDDALSTDPMSAFGGVVALNRTCDGSTAEAVTDSFKEVVVAPSYTDPALSILEEEANLRVLDVGHLDAPDGRPPGVVESHLSGGRLVQERDDWRPEPDDLDVVTDRDPTPEQVETMCFAWRVVKHVRSNAIVLATDTETVGVGAGQMSRVDAVRVAAMKADEHAEGTSADGAVLASDAFFPFPDGVERAAEAGVEVIIQPGGSVNDDDVVAAADDLGLVMVFSDHRAFRHG